jgi:hypothetical protein
MIAMIQGVQMNHLMCLPFMANFFLRGDRISWAPPKAHAHEQKALPRNKDPIKRSMNIKKLPQMIPFVPASMIT